MASLPATDRNLAGQRAVVTGSSSGIGRAIVLQLAAAGADVLVHCHESQAEAESVAELARVHGVRAFVTRADLRDAGECHELVTRSWALLGTCDIWVNNAGADVLTGPAARLSFEEKFAELVAVDLRATLLLGRAVGERMQAAGSGVILNMGWDRADIGMEGDSGQLFAAVKAAVMAFTKSLALSLAPRIRVNCLAPGWIRTAWGEQASQSWQQRAQREAPLGRWGTSEDVAQVAHFLCSPAATFITGQVVRINGGAVR